MFYPTLNHSLVVTSGHTVFGKDSGGKPSSAGKGRVIAQQCLTQMEIEEAPHEAAIISCVARCSSLTSLGCNFIVCQWALIITARPFMAFSGGANDVNHMKALSSSKFYIVALPCTGAAYFTRADSHSAGSELQ